MEIIYSDEAQKDVTFWKKSGNKAVQQKIQQLLSSIKKHLTKASESQNR